MSFSELVAYLVVALQQVVRIMSNIYIGNISLLRWSIGIGVLHMVMVILVRAGSRYYNDYLPAHRELLGSGSQSSIGGGNKQLTSGGK
jgi:hypothetical protein